MTPFQKDKLLLLQEIREIVSEELTKSHENRFGNLSERRQNRKLKLIRREIDRWITETIQYRKDVEAERRIRERERIEAATNASERYNTPA